MFAANALSLSWNDWSVAPIVSYFLVYFKSTLLSAENINWINILSNSINLFKYGFVSFLGNTINFKAYSNGQMHFRTFSVLITLSIDNL